MLTLPSKGLGWNLILVIFVGAAIAIPAMWMMWKGIKGDETTIDKDFKKVLVLMTITVVFMGSGRQIYRANALEKHRELVRLKTEEFQQIKKKPLQKQRGKSQRKYSNSYRCSKRRKRIQTKLCCLSQTRCKTSWTTCYRNGFYIQRKQSWFTKLD